jgi:hypothetical protein
VESLEDRINQFWEARKAGDLLTLYQLEAVSVTKQVTIRQYVNNSGDLVYKNFRIIEIKSENTNSAHALIEVEVMIPGLSKSVKSQFEDKWVKLEGQWYHFGRAHLPSPE